MNENKRGFAFNLRGSLNGDNNKSVCVPLRVHRIVMHTHLCIRLSQCFLMFCGAPVLVHASGVCISMPFAVFVCAPVQVHALS